MKKTVWIIVLLLVITLGLLWYVEKQKSIVAVIPEKKVLEEKQNNNLAVNFLDVGQGDAGLIKFSNGEKMLVDCGPDAGILSALGRVLPYYDRDLDYLVITHPDADHYGGCIDVLDRFKIKNIVYNGLKKPGDNFWEYFWQKIKDEGAKFITIDQEQTWNINSSTLHFLFPDVGVNDLSSALKTKDNNTSIVFSLENSGKKILFVADAENELEQYLLNKYKDNLKSDILKVGHHGSGGSSGRLFLEAVAPQYAVISVGKDNTFGHPSLRVIKKIERTGAKIFRTDEMGDINVVEMWHATSSEMEIVLE